MQQPLPQGNTLFAVTYGHGQFVAEHGSIVTSPDGRTWTAQVSGMLAAWTG